MYKDGMNVFGGKKMVHIKIGVLPLKRNRIFFLVFCLTKAQQSNFLSTLELWTQDSLESCSIDNSFSLPIRS